MSPNWWRSPCNRCHDICREKKNHPLSLCTLMDTAHQWHRSRRETPKRNDQGYWWDCIDGSCDVERLRGCHRWTSQKIWLYPWYLWPCLSSSHLQSSGAEGIQLLWLSILKRFEKFSRQWRKLCKQTPQSANCAMKRRHWKWHSKCAVMSYDAATPVRSDGSLRVAEVCKSRIFLNIFLFPPGDVFSPVQFLGKQGLAFENIGFAGEPSSGHKNAWKHRNFRNLEIKQFQIQGK